MHLYVYLCTYTQSGGNQVELLRVSPLPLGKFTVSLEKSLTGTAVQVAEFTACCEDDVRKELKREVSCHNILGTYYWGKQKWIVPKARTEKAVLGDLEFEFVKRWKRNYSGNLVESFWRTVREMKVDYKDLGERTWILFWN